MSLPRGSRLTAPGEFQKVFQQPVVSSDAWFRVLARPNGLSGSRLGLAVSRRFDPRAVERNRVKRLVRESFRQHYVSGRETCPADFVVLPQRPAVSTSNAQLRDRLERHWQRVDQRLVSATA